jgi:hypothetical protein
MMARNRTHWGLLAAAAIGGFGLGRLQDPAVQLSAGLVLAAAAVVGFVWRSRVQAARRWRAALDAYADRTLARQQHHLPRNARVA